MCIKAGVDELDSVKNLMSMALKAVVAEALHVELEDVVEDARLAQDLHMGPAQAKALRALIADTFDGVMVTVDETTTYADLLQSVVLNEFCDLAA